MLHNWSSRYPSTVQAVYLRFERCASHKNIQQWIFVDLVYGRQDFYQANCNFLKLNQVLFSSEKKKCRVLPQALWTRIPEVLSILKTKAMSLSCIELFLNTLKAARYCGKGSGLGIRRPVSVLLLISCLTMDRMP